MTVGELLKAIIWAFILFLAIQYIKKYSNPFKLFMFIGKKGSGKSTLIVKLALKYIKKGWAVYCNKPINVPGVRLFDVKLMGDFGFPKKSVIFIDEAGIEFDNRLFKTFSEKKRNYFKYQRHYKNIVYLFSQDFDVDVKIRKLCDAIFLCTCHLNVFGFARRISRSLQVVQPTAEAEGRIADGLELDPLWLQILGMRVSYFTFIPKYTKYFDSFESVDLVPIPYQVVEAVENQKRRFLDKLVRKRRS